MTAAAIAADVRSGKLSARSIVEKTLAAIDARNWEMNAVTRVLRDRAIADAKAVDAKIAARKDPGPLAGVPFAVKDLFDITGLATTAGSRTRAQAVPAPCDADAIDRLVRAGAVLCATCNMDEFAYGFVTINAHYRTTRNPHDPMRLAGGSSGGSAAVVGSGLLPISLGSDTNGSVRVPASLCGIYGLKPTHGDLPVGGMFPFVDSFDDAGPFARTLGDLRLTAEILRGRRYEVAPVPTRIGTLDGWFAANSTSAMADAVDRVAGALAADRTELPAVAEARSAAFLMTAYEGGQLHLPTLRLEAMGYDPGVRDRLIAGAMLPAEAYDAAKRFRRWFRKQADALFTRFDVLIAPSTPGHAPLISDPMIEVDGQRVPARAHLGLYTQPISFIGLPAISVPLADCGPLPLGLQLIGPPGGEARLFSLAERLEEMGLVAAWPARG